MGRQGNFPIVAPVKPYTELALIYKINHSEEDIEEAGARRTNLKGELPSIQNSLFKRVRLFLQICFCAFPCRDQVFQNSREQPLSSLARYEKICEKYLNEKSVVLFSRLAIIGRMDVIFV
jgi:hypothetical protein